VEELAAVIRSIIGTNRYLTPGTAGADGPPWVSPVYFASARYPSFYWVLSPDAKHSRNISVRPQISMVVFDSQAAIGTGQGVYVAADAKELSGAALTQAIEIYSRKSQLIESGVRLRRS
jgi:uncharacterized protein YhbP (UPF0306 family)